MINTTVTTSKAKTMPHPKVGSGNAAVEAYNKASEKGKDMTFLPKEKEIKNK